MAELEFREPGGDGSAGAANVGFQTALWVPALSVRSNQGREDACMQAGWAPRKGLGQEGRQEVSSGLYLITQQLGILQNITSSAPRDRGVPGSQLPGSGFPSCLDTLSCLRPLPSSQAPHRSKHKQPSPPPALLQPHCIESHA